MATFFETENMTEPTNELDDTIDLDALWNETDEDGVVLDPGEAEAEESEVEAEAEEGEEGEAEEGEAAGRSKIKIGRRGTGWNYSPGGQCTN
jgi:hypothetical protein